MNITQKVISFQMGYWTKEDTIQEIKLHCLAWTILKWGWAEDRAIDFWAFVHPQFTRSLYSFSFSGKSFLRYMRKVIYFQAKTYSKKERSKAIQWKDVNSTLRENYNISRDGARRRVNFLSHYWPESADPHTSTDSPSSSTDNVYTSMGMDSLSSLYLGERSEYTTIIRHKDAVDKEGNPEVIGSMRNLSAPKKLLLLYALLKVEHLNDESLSKLSEQIGVPIIHLLAFRQQAFEVVQRKLGHKELMRIRRTKKLMRVFWGDENLEVKEEMRTYLGESFKNIQRLNVHPSQSDLAKITGIPIGTVGSSMYIHRKKIARETDDSNSE